MNFENLFGSQVFKNRNFNPFQSSLSIRFSFCICCGIFSLFNPFAPGDSTEERVFKLVERFSGHCGAIKS